ncbi:ABC transporter ATP-binding protein [Sediminivirga luteola]|uniref:ABC transporter ATP-binding protein n=1 Tax=Sediminivirga luteola TaxID=1774748 RepID=A0A8J2TW53_9MICO|nr:ABC transporter ATP-binding protein [Sediminivirga luteola]GGA06388.1 ABC transporter ATP-binding protein [Sediminivirga luteola]
MNAQAPRPQHRSGTPGATLRPGDLRLDGVIGRGGFRLPLTMDFRAGETLVLLGANGAGKSTLLETLGGLIPLLEGELLRIGSDGATVLSGPRGTVPAERRRAGFVHQDYLLFPRMTALENVAFGLRARGVGKKEAHASAAAQLRRLGLTEAQAGSRPGALSGGQRQRVALARALAGEPDMLLLDVPLAALDAGTRAQARAQVYAQLREFPGPRVLVTHDLTDALSLGDRIAVLDQGTLAQIDSPAEITRTPRTPYLAELLGINLFSGLARRGRLSIGHSRVTAPTELDGRVLVTLPREAVTVNTEAPAKAGRNTFEARVVAVQEDAQGITVAVSPTDPDVGLACSARVPLTSLPTAPIRLGAPVWATVDESALHAYPF